MKGFELAQGEILAFTDADNATIASELRKLIIHTETRADAAIGPRWLPESRQDVRQPSTRQIASRVFNLIVRALFQFPYNDTQCGASFSGVPPLNLSVIWSPPPAGLSMWI